MSAVESTRYRISTVAGLSNLAEATIRKRVKQGQFPKPVKATGKTTPWQWEKDVIHRHLGITAANDPQSVNDAAAVALQGFLDAVQPLLQDMARLAVDQRLGELRAINEQVKS